MTFTLDTGGAIYLRPHDNDDVPVTWSDLPPFVQGKLAAMWQSVRELRRDAEDAKQINLDDLGFRHLSPATLERIMGDCERDQQQGSALGNREDRETVEAGRRFWAERQTGNLFDCPPLTVFLSDEGKVEVREVQS